MSGAPLLSGDAPLKDHRRAPRAANRGSYQMGHGVTDGTMGNRSSRKTHVRARSAGAVTTSTKAACEPGGQLFPREGGEEQRV